MHYFLTSNPIMLDKTEINPANCFIENLNALIDTECNILYIASSPDAYDITDYYADELKVALSNSKLSYKSFITFDMRIMNELDSLIKSADVIILAGGHVPTQNQFFLNINLKVKLSHFDGVIIGISAGSMNSAETVYAQPELEKEANNDNYIPFLSGLGITTHQIIPHYQLIKDETINGKRLFEDLTYPLSFDNQFLALNDGSYIYGNSDSETLFGEAYLIHNGNATLINSDSSSITLKKK